MSKPAIAEPSSAFVDDRWNRLSALLIGLLFLAAFAPTLPELVGEWIERPEFSHGFLMPLVALWMVWDRREELKRLRLAPARAAGFWSLTAALGGVFMMGFLLLGEMKLSWYLKPYALVAGLGFLIWALYGWRVFRSFLAPLFVLFLMCPLPGRVERDITLPLKVHASIMATGLLDLSGIETMLDGNLIDLPGYPSQQVANACSGLRSAISLTSVALLAVLFWPRHLILKSVVVVSAVPIAMIVNSFRIWLAGYLTVHVSPDAAKGFLHTFEGLVMFAFGAVILLLWATLLDKLTGGDPKETEEAAPKAEPPMPSAPARIGAAGWVARSILVIALAVTVYEVYRVRGRLARGDADPRAVAALKKSLDSLPNAVGDAAYLGEDYKLDQAIIDESGADLYASKIYRDAAGHSYRLYVGGAVRNQENFHAPSYCMPAQGWEILEQTVTPFSAYEVNQDEPTMRRLVLQRARDRMVVYYWFQAGDRLADHEWVVRYYRFLDLLQDAPFRPTVIAILYVRIHGTVEQTEERAVKFMAAVGPHVQKAISLKPGA